eukprot:g496.t1
MKVLLAILMLLTMLSQSQGNLESESCHCFVDWSAPVGCDFSGFFLEFLSYARAVDAAQDPCFEFRFHVGTCAQTMLSLLSPAEADFVRRRLTNKNENKNNKSTGKKCTIAISHKLPGQAYNVPGASYTIGRQMFEAAQPDQDDVRHACLALDELWAPTDLHATRLREAGVQNVRVMPQAIDTELFSRLAGRESPHFDKSLFSFFSVFKMEHRNGFDILLKAFWEEFEPSDPVELVLRTWKPSWERTMLPPRDAIRRIAREDFRSHPKHLARVRIIEPTLSREQLRDCYFSSNAFVLPTRGEGWCRPAIEALAMELPTIVSNVSGPRSYLMEEDLIIPVRHENTDMPEPDRRSLRAAMRRIFSRATRHEKGKQDKDEEERRKNQRRNIALAFRPSAVSDLVLSRLHEISSHLISSGVE